MRDLPKVGEMVIFRRPNCSQLAKVVRICDNTSFEVYWERVGVKRAMLLNINDHYVKVSIIQIYSFKIFEFLFYVFRLMVMLLFILLICVVLTNWWSNCKTTRTIRGLVCGETIIDKYKCNNLWTVIILYILKYFDIYPISVYF